MFYEKEFLLQLDKVKNKIIHARITALTFNEQPIETIEGRITQGSINVDGNSAVRRTCSLTMIAKDFNYQNYYWGLNTKFKLEIGIENHIDSRYPNIIWFKQGIYLFTSFNTSRNTSSFTISLQGKDKMCLLNGEVGGSLESSIDFGNIEEENSDGLWTIKAIPLRDIIRNAVHTYAGEPYHNIIINDLEDYGLELLEYRYDIPMYLYRPAGTETEPERESPIFANILMNGDLKCQVDRLNSEGQYERKSTTIGDLRPDELDMLVDTLMGTANPSKIWIWDDNKNKYMPYYFAKIEDGQTAGYRITDLTYAGDLIANIGESITSVLDKIKNMLSEFEYFYDLDGQFVFQRKKSFVNTLWSPDKISLTEDENMNIHSEKYVESIANATSLAYIFNEGELITAFNNNPNLLNMRNDFSIWGVRKGISGADIPVHLRYAIDIKPTYYTSFDGITYTIRSEEEVKEDRKAFEFGIVDNGYKKEKSRFGLGEDWWEVRDWAKAWVYSGLPIPSAHLGKYCPIRALVYPEDTPPENLSNYLKSCEHYPVSREVWDSWGEKVVGKNYIATDDLIFYPDGTFWDYHGGCAHSYTQWLDYFNTDGKYEGGYAYFYKPQVPADEMSNGQGLILGEQIRYNLDWRELIYQMAKDYYKHNQEDDFELTLRENNINFYPSGQTGYERYYIDIQGFWRQLYNPFIADDIAAWEQKINAEEAYKKFLQDFLNAWDRYLQAKPAVADLRYKEFLKKFEDNSVIQRLITYDSVFESCFLYEEIDSEKIYTLDETQINYLIQLFKVEINNSDDNIKIYNDKIDSINQSFSNYYEKGHKNEYWLKNVYEYPETLNFWFDFLDAEGELSQFNVKNVGARSKAVNETTIKSIYFRETPNVIFKSPDESFEALSGYKYIQVQDIDNMFSISSQGKSAKDKLDELIYKHGYCIENATITTIPIYYLEPNVRIHIHDQETNLNGDYIISKMTIPLAYNGTMQLTATKAAESII